jgi:folate-binding protein YgfZ
MFWINKSAIVLSVHGPHAVRYLNARLTNDILRLEIGKCCLAAALTPQGKTEAIFLVLKKAADSALIICDGGERAAVLAAFRRYIVADRVEVQDVSASFEVYHSYSLIADHAEVASINSTKNIGNSWLVGRYRSDQLGIDIIKSKEDALGFIKDDSLTDEEAKALRVAAKIPSFPEELEDRLFLEAHLPGSISSTKGCYTGQEVVERILSHGKSPKTLKAVRFMGTDPAIGAKVVFNNTNVGEVVSKVFSTKLNSLIGFVSIKNDDSIATSNLTAEAASLVDL